MFCVGLVIPESDQLPFHAFCFFMWHRLCGPRGDAGAWGTEEGIICLADGWVVVIPENGCPFTLADQGHLLPACRNPHIRLH